MKKLILKTALITFASAILILVIVFGSLSIWAPSIMCEFTASIGLKGLSGGFAYSAYEATGEIDYLAYACTVASDGKEAITVERYEKLFEEEGFLQYCAAQDELQRGNFAGLPMGSYAQYCYGNYACALYREGEASGAIAFVFTALEGRFEESNCAISLSLAIVQANDKTNATQMKTQLEAYSVASEDEPRKQEIITILEEYINE